MRNWYAFFDRSNICREKACRTLPMRNWYIYAQTLSASSWSVKSRTLPMRNWYTHPQVFYILVASKLLIRRTLPMRNWYIFEKRFQIIQRIIIGKKSDITYEELIREKVVLMMVSSSLEASDITYEELILFCRFNICRENALSDITYEELIHFLWFNSCLLYTSDAADE